jgi:hypothetical protein
MIEFNELGTPVGTKPVAVLDNTGTIINIITVQENETSENIQNFVQVDNGESYVDITATDVFVGCRFDGSDFILPEHTHELPEEMLAVLNDPGVYDPEALAAKQAAREAADRIDGLTE